MAASQLKVKAGACRRIQKELQMYVQEEREARGKVEKLTADGGDSHDIKYAVSFPGPAPKLAARTDRRSDHRRARASSPRPRRITSCKSRWP
jgi:hypothetical protein